MYCRKCYYDLSGQVTQRCPECGTPFAFNDPTSFHARVPGRAKRVVYLLRRKRAVILAAMLIPLFLTCAFLNSQQKSHHPIGYARSLAYTNLKNLMTTWLIYMHDSPDGPGFDIAIARNYLGPSISPWSEYEVIERMVTIRNFLARAPLFLVPAIAYFLLAAVLSEKPTPRAIWVPLAGVDITWDNPTRGDTITAFDIHSFKSETKRLIAFGDGHVDRFHDKEARALFQAQGIPYPESAK